MVTSAPTMFPDPTFYPSPRLNSIGTAAPAPWM
jgi:hypothetical protein